jgi:hypothetical protein
MPTLRTLVLPVLLAGAGVTAVTVTLVHRPRAAGAPAAEVASAPPLIVAERRPRRPAAALTAAPPPAPDPADDTEARTLKEQRKQLFRTMATQLDLTEAQVDAVRRVVEGSPWTGQGNPAITHHGMSRGECRARREAAGARVEPHPPCARRNMVPLYDPEIGETPADARVCIDQFEFPDIPCEYPVVFASAREAAQMCAAAGKRICDAHEWEGACAGALHKPEDEYAFGDGRPHATWKHNKDREVRWAYGPKRDLGVCAMGTVKTAGCLGGGWGQCGSNTYPAGSFPACVSPLGVYDQHGNAAEHMNLPQRPEELASAGGSGATEMKGSWFVFQHEDAHEDDCRWRAKDWHPSKLMAEESHRNYHLGFRCCADVAAPEEEEPEEMEAP